MKNCPMVTDNPSNTSKATVFQRAEQLKELYRVADFSFVEVETIYKQEAKTMLWTWCICMILLLPVLYWSNSLYINSIFAITVVLIILVYLLEPKSKKSIERLNQFFTPKFNELLTYFDTPDERISIKYRNLNWDARYLILTQINKIFNDYFEIIKKELKEKTDGDVYLWGKNELMVAIKKNDGETANDRHNHVLAILKAVSFRFGIDHETRESVVTAPGGDGRAVVIYHQINLTVLNSTITIKVT